MVVVIPKVEYTLPVWCQCIACHTANARQGPYNMPMKGKIQRLVCKLITGAFGSTVMDILESHVKIPPVHLQLSSICHWKALQLCSLPPLHPLHTSLRHAAKSPPRHHCSQLHILLHLFSLQRGVIQYHLSSPFRAKGGSDIGFSLCTGLTY